MVIELETSETKGRKDMNLKNLNLKYALVNAGFMLLVAGSIGFAYNYLSQSGFDPGTIGTVMSIVSLGGVFLGPAIGDLADRSERITQKMIITASMAICGVLAALLLVIPSGSFMILPIVIVAFMSAMVGMPLLNGMAFIYEKAGGVINYGLCRGIGSAAYAVGSSLVGRLWASLGRNTLPIWIIMGAILTGVAINLMPDAPKELAATDDEPAEPKGESISVLQFFSKYPSTTIVCLSLVLLYFCHNVFQTYCGAVLAEFVPAADVERVQGNAFFIQAMVELPTMFGFALILKRFKVNQILAASAVFYSLKHVILAMANSVPMFYAGMVLQMLSYAAITPAVVYYANEQVNEEDRNKSQAVFMTANSVGGLLASFVGGWLFQLLSVRMGLTVGVIASVIGTVLMVMGTRKQTA